MFRVDRRRFAGVLLAFGLVAAVGCGGGDVVAETKTALRGKLLVNKKPVNSGTVTAYKGGSKVATTNVNPDGTFEFLNIATGDYQLAVTNTETDTPYGKGVKLNSRYADPATSGMTVSVAGKDESPREFNVEVAK